MEYNTRIYDYGDSVNVTVYSKHFERSGEDADQSVAVNENFTKSYKNSGRTEKAAEKCAASSLRCTRNTVYNIARSNIWDWFVTLTFDQKKYPSDNYDFCVGKLTSFLKILRMRDPSLAYLFVPELHKDGKHYHFHGLLIGSPEGIVDSGKEFDGQPVYNWTKWKYGFSTLTEVKSQRSVSGYVAKYMTKANNALLPNKKRYYASQNLHRVQPDFCTVDPVDFVSENAGNALHVSGKTVPCGGFSVNYYEFSGEDRGNPNA